MRKQQFDGVKKYILLFGKFTSGICDELSKKPQNILKAQEYLEMAQQKAIDLGTYIEELEGEGHPTVSELEVYCDVLYQIHEEIAGEHGLSAASAKSRLDTAVKHIENSANKDIKIKRVAVFLPYKASLWDSLESVWMAADADEDCEAFVVPIPYFDKQGDKLVAEHYEIDLYPDYVPVVDHEKFDLEGCHPDIIFIHNPYDTYNNVTTIHPYYYSDKLKEMTDCLVYIPYYATSGGTGEGQSFCPVYQHADYIVLQSETTKGFINPMIPREKLLGLGSPKFDSVIKKCQNPPEPPSEWKEKMAGKKVYFYNTSLSGMLSDTPQFFKKMEYVFNCFKGREDACLLWRPHPLFESTLQSMRPQFLKVYHELQRRFKEEKIGIYDDTPFIEDTIAQSDVYIGDTGTSVTALFGVAGKPIFALDNNIIAEPTEDDIRANAYFAPRPDYDVKYYVLPGTNQLYEKSEADGKFYYFCELSEYSSGAYYQGAYKYKDKIVVVPANAQEILLIDEKRTIRKVDFADKIEQMGAFSGYFVVENMIVIFPVRYEHLVIFDMESEKVIYLNNISNFNVALQPNGERIPAARWISGDKICIMSNDGKVLMLFDLSTMSIEKRQVDWGKLYWNSNYKKSRDNEIWLIPYEGTVVRYYNIETGETREYDLRVDGLENFDRIHHIPGNRYWFGSAAFLEDKIIFPAYYGNKFVALDADSGEVSEWKTQFDCSAENYSSYIINYGIGSFVPGCNDAGKVDFFYSKARENYVYDMASAEFTKADYEFDREDVLEHSSGFGPCNQWIQYCCNENVFNSLKDLLDEKIHGNQYSKEATIKAYLNVNASPEGDCGEKVYEFLKSR